MGIDSLPRPPSRGRGARRVAAGPGGRPGCLGDVTVLAVPDGLVALGAIASGWRSRFDPLIVGVTGSIAKTSTKEAVAAVLGSSFRTLRSGATRTTRSDCP